MNHYKMAWQSHVDSDYSPLDNQDQREKDTFTDRVKEDIKQIPENWLVEAAAYTALTYMATSHYGKLRIVGSVGLRLLPVIGVAAIAYSVYTFMDD